MAYTIKQYAEALYHSLQEAGPKDHNAIIENLVQVMKRNSDLSKYEQVVFEYERIQQKADGVIPTEITVAKKALADDKIWNDLNKQADNKLLKLRKKVDEEIIGGVVIRMGDTQIDASIRTQLDSLKSL